MAPLVHLVNVDSSAGTKIGFCCNKSWYLQPSINGLVVRGWKYHVVSGSNLNSLWYGLYTSPIKSFSHGRGRYSTFRALYESGSAGDGDGGDSKIQQMLVDMVRIQVGKARMIEFVDERSQHLRNIADEAIVDYDRIAYKTMKGLDATGSRVLRQLDADVNAVVKDLMIARAELEAQSKDFEEFQVRVAYSRNEGLFFKSLYRSPSGWGRAKLTKDLENKVAQVTIESGKDFSDSYRQILYGGLSLVMVSFIWSSSSSFMAGTCMRVSKLASYGIIFSLLLTQLAYFKLITGYDDEETNK